MEPSRQKWEGIDWLSLLAILVVGVILRCYPVHENVWVDELHTAWAVSADDAQFTQRVRLGNNGPTYFLFVKAATQFLGMHEWTLRLVSIVAGIALIPATFRLCRIWRCSVEASLLAASLVAIDRNAVFYSVEARPYICVQLLSVFHLLLFSKLLLQRHHVWDWIAWILTGILMFHLHCTSALIFPAEVVAFAVLWLRKFETKLHWIYFLLGLVVILAGMIPALGLIREVTSRRENWEQFVPRTRNPLRVLTIFPLTYYLITPLVIWLLSIVVGRLQIRTDDDESLAEVQSDETEEMMAGAMQRNLEFRIVLVVGLCWLLVPILLAFVLTERDLVRLFFARYLAAASVVLAPLTALIATRFLRGRRLAVLGALGIFVLGVLTISSAKHYRYGTQALAHSQENWRSPVSLMRSDDLPIVLYSGLMEASHWYDSDDPSKRAYCELPVRSIYAVDEDREVIALPARTPLALSVETVARLQSMSDKQAEGFWLLIRGDRQLASEVQGELLKILGRDFRVLDTRDFGTKVHLRRIGRQT